MKIELEEQFLNSLRIKCDICGKEAPVNELKIRTRVEIQYENTYRKERVCPTCFSHLNSSAD